MSRKAVLRVAVALPQQVEARVLPAGTLQRFARRAERLGFDGLWTQESIGGTSRALEPLTALAAAAAVTSRIELGVAVVLSLYRQPIQLARVCATVDQLSGGRLVVGVGLGERGHNRAFGLPAERRVTRFVDGVELMRRLWREERVTMTGLDWHLEDWPSGLQPARVGGPPIWLGGHHPDVIRRAIRLGDGWIGAGGASSREFLEAVVLLHDGLAEASAAERPFVIGKRVYLAVGRRRHLNRNRLRDWFGQRYRDPDRADRVAIASDPAGVIAELAPLIEAGADYLVLNPLFDEPRQLEVLATEVVPALRRIAASSPRAG